MLTFFSLKNKVAFVPVLLCAGLIFGLYFSATAVKKITLVSNSGKDAAINDVQIKNAAGQLMPDGTGVPAAPNLTASLGQKLLEVLNSKSDNGLLNQDPREALKKINGKDLGSIVKELAAENSIGAIRSIPDSEIKFTASDDRNAGLAYIDSVTRLVSENLNTSSLNKDPLDALDFAINSDGFTSLNPAADAYKKISVDLKNVVVPKSWIHIHKELITYFDLMSRIFNSLSQADSDPLGAMMGLGILDDTVKMRQETNQKIRQLMSRQKINFTL